MQSYICQIILGTLLAMCVVQWGPRIAPQFIQGILRNIPQVIVESLSTFSLTLQVSPA